MRTTVLATPAIVTSSNVLPAARAAPLTSLLAIAWRAFVSISFTVVLASSAMAQTPKLPPLPPDVLRAAEEFNNRKKYQAFDLQTLRSIKDEHLEQALLDYIFSKLEARPGQDREVIAGLSREFQAFYISWLVEAEVMNGGLNQFFWNSSSEFAEEAPGALKEIGDEAASEIMQRAIAVAIEEIPVMTKFRQAGTLEAFSESYNHTKLSELDEPFCLRAEGFAALRLRYVRKHERAFVTP